MLYVKTIGPMVIHNNENCIHWLTLLSTNITVTYSVCEWLPTYAQHLYLCCFDQSQYDNSCVACMSECMSIPT